MFKYANTKEKCGTKNTSGKRLKKPKNKVTSKTPGKSFTKNIRKTTLKNAKNKASLEVNHVRAPTTTIYIHHS